MLRPDGVPLYNFGAVVDDVTFRGDRVRAYLDEEEQVIRRRILADWRDACGR
jgi:hypothetical protein